jgi:hypothetical protein
MKIITGEWDGQPIWREETAEDKLQAIMAEEKMSYINKQKLDLDPSNLINK